nr:putative ribonuclease H-like domain-containing protein [Tanacetum cinerariifolium]
MSGSLKYLEGSINEDFPTISKFRLTTLTEGLAVLKLLELLVGSGPTTLTLLELLKENSSNLVLKSLTPATSAISSSVFCGVWEPVDHNGKVREEIVSAQQYVLLPLWSTGSQTPQNTDDDIADVAFDVKENEKDVHVYANGRVRDLRTKFEEFSFNSSNRVNVVGPDPTNSSSSFNTASPSVNVVSLNFGIVGKSSFMDPSKYFNDPDMPELEDIVYSDDVGPEADLSNLETNIPVSPISTTRVHKDHPVNQIIDLHNGKRAIGSKWVFRNKKDEKGIVIRNKARLFAQGHTQEEGIDYNEVFAPVARIEAIRLFLAYASFMGFMVYQMDVKSAFFYGTIKEEVYVCQPLGFEDPDYPDEVYKVVKALDGLHQASKAWRTHFLLGLQVKQKDDRIFISQDKYIAEILRKFGFTDVKSASTPIETEKPLLKDPDGEDMDVHIYWLMIGSLMYLSSSRPDIMHLKGKPHLGLWYPRDSLFNLVAYFDSDYAGASLDRKSTTGEKQYEVFGMEFACTQMSQVLVKHHTTNGYQFTMSNRHQELTSPEKTASELIIPKQTTLGKEFLNSFMAGSLPITIWHFITAVSYELMLFGLLKVATVNLMLLGHKLMLSMATTTIKKVNDDDQLHALIDGKKVVVSEAIIKRDIHLDDADGVECLSNDEIFKELARMGYEKPPSKLTFYKAFFSVQWKFMIHTLVQCLSAKRIAWNEFSYSMPSALIYLATGRKFNFSKYIFDSMVRNVDNPRGKIAAIDADKGITLVDVETNEEGVSVVSAPELVSDAETIVFDDDDVTITMAQTLIKLKAEKAKLLDQQIAHKLHDEEVQKVTARDKQEKANRKRALELQRQKYQNLKKKPVSITQARKNMIIYLKNMAGYKMEFFRGMTYDKEIHTKGSRIYWKIIRVRGITKAYQIFEDMLKGFDREDLVALWNLVKEKFSSAVPSEDKEKALWVELKRLFEPDADDVLWKLQRYMHAPVTWKLYGDCERYSYEDLHGGQQTKEQKFRYILLVIKMLKLKKLDV